jgi:hypothetical protein
VLKSFVNVAGCHIPVDHSNDKVTQREAVAGCIRRGDVETPAARLLFFAVVTNRRRICSAFIWTGEYTLRMQM